MEHSVQWQFADFHLDPTNACLRQQQRLVKLKLKTFAILHYLIERAGRLVTKEELFAALWPETVVSDGVLTTLINELRTALHDDAKAPRFIETMHRRGYRFIAAVTTVPSPMSHAVSPIPDTGTDGAPLRDQKHQSTGEREATQSEMPVSFLPYPCETLPATTIVGRASELAVLHQFFAQAVNGARQLVFITGEPGIGKTGVVEAFLATLPQRRTLWIGHGQCIEQFGGGEPFLPVLEALGRLGSGPARAQATALLRQHAPTWLLQLPTLLTPAEHEQLQHHAIGGTRDRMLREFCQALEAFTTTQPVILVLEDLHWSDLSTLELLAALARRRESARLLIIGTYRPVDVIVRGHPIHTVKQELHVHGLCHELALPYLEVTAVATYLAQRFAPNDFLTDLADLLFQRTEGNPLFMVNLVETWVAQGAIAQAEGTWKLTYPLTQMASTVSPSLTQFIEQQLTRLDTGDQELLEAASVMGRQFSVAAVASAVDRPATALEEHCERLARRHLFLARLEEQRWPESRNGADYAFLHTLYQATAYARLARSRRVLLHHRVGTWLEETAGAQARQRAVELAVHFEEGQEHRRAIHYRQQAGEMALQRSALQEAIDHFTTALTLLEALPQTPEGVQHELLLCTQLGAAFVMSKGYAAKEVEQPYARAQTLCQQLGEHPHLVPAQLGLWGFYITRGEFSAAQHLADNLFRLARDSGNATLLLGASRAVGITQYYLGDLSTARACLEQGIASYDPVQHRPRTFLYAVADPGVACFCYHALTLWMIGYPSQALAQIYKALALAQELSHPFSHAFALDFAAIVHQLRREDDAVRAQLDASLRLAHEQGFGQFLLFGAILKGWTLAEQGQQREGIALMRDNLARAQTLGATIGRPYYLALFAETLAAAGELEAGLQLLDEALTDIRCSNEYNPELYRLKGELTLQKVHGARSMEQVGDSLPLNPDPQGEAERYFCQAVTLAQQQQAKSLELRAVLSLSRLWQQQRKRQKAHRLLADTYRWFTEGFDTKDLQEAKALLG